MGKAQAREVSETARRFTFLLLPEFSMMPFTSAIEPLRAANRMSGAMLYSWTIASLDGGPVSASNGVTIRPDSDLAGAMGADVVVVCSGLDAEAHATPALLAALRRIERKGIMLGAVCTGSVVLARAGLLDGYRCTIHWQDIASFAENYPALEVSSRLYEIDRDRFTCSGGTAPLDLMIHLIARDFGRPLSVSVAELMLHHIAREASEPQRLSLPERTGVHHPKLLEAIARMEERIEAAMHVDGIAALAGLSPRQLERLFRFHLATTPSRYYLRLRLERARHLLRQTASPIMQIALSTGFTSAAHFTKCYRETYGQTPSAERRTGQRGHRLMRAD